MKRSFTVSLLVIALCGPALAQKIQLHQLKFSDQIEKERKAGTLRQTSAAYYHTYIGNYQKGLELYELPIAWGMDTITAQEKVDFKQYQAVNALEYLEERTQEEQLVIISEAHQKPEHRVFTKSLLQSLYYNGFRYLGLETLTSNYEDSTKFMMDVSLNERGYPFDSPITGTYTIEPQMSNLVREAIALGFEVFAYENTSRKRDRDLQQAMNIKRFMDEHPEGKVLIHCGWYHAIESDFSKRKNDNWMAYHLKRLTGIDPLTIYQDLLNERLSIAESPYYSLINSKEVSVMVNEEGEIFNGKKGMNHFDMLIYHPRNAYRKNRPRWLYKQPDYTFVKVKKKLIKETAYPVLVKAYPAGDPPEAAPVDIIELTSAEDKTYLVLKKGKYRIVIVSQEGTEAEYPLEFN